MGERSPGYFDSIKKFLVPAVVALGLHTAVGKYAEHEADKITALSEARQELLVENEDHLIAPEWSTDPEELEKQIETIATDVRGNKDKVTAEKIDMGKLMIADMEAHGKLNHEEAEELRLILAEKRDYYKELAKTHDKLEVLHEITQEHKHYDPHAEFGTIASFLKKQKSNCRSALAGFTAIVQSVYPDLELKIEHSKGTLIPHVRLLGNLKVNPKDTESHWVAIERGGLIPLNVKDLKGRVIQDISAIPFVLSHKPAGGKKLTGEIGEFSAPDPLKVDESKKMLADETPDDIGVALSGALDERPTVTHVNEDIARPDEKPRERRTFAQAEKDLEKANPTAYQERKVLRKKIRHAQGLDHRAELILINEEDRKVADLKVVADAEIFTHVIQDNTLTPEQKILKLQNIVDEYKAGPKRFQKFLMTTEAQSPGISKTELFRRLVKFIDQEATNLKPDYRLTREQEVNWVTDMAVHSGEIRDSNHYVINTADRTVTHYNLIPLSEKEIKDIAEKAAKAKIPITNISLTSSPVKSINKKWFKELTFDPQFDVKVLDFHSQDRTIEVLNRADIRRIDQLKINAPVGDFSPLHNIKIGNITLNNFVAMPGTDQFKDLTSHGELKFITLANPHPGVEISQLDNFFDGNDIGGSRLLTVSFIVSDNDALKAHRKQLHDIKSVNSQLEIEMHGNELNLESLRGTAFGILTVKNRSIKEDWSVLATMPNLAIVTLEFAELPSGEDNGFKTVEEALRFSKQFPNITFTIPNPEYDDDEHSQQTYKSLESLEIQNGEISPIMR